jgi:hypothetical protein
MNNKILTSKRSWFCSRILQIIVMHTFPFTKYFVNMHGTPNCMKLVSHEFATLKLFDLLKRPCWLLYRGNTPGFCRHPFEYGSRFQRFSYVFLFILRSLWTLDSAVGVAIGYGQEGRGVEVQVPVGIFFSSLHHLHHLGPTQPHIKWVPGAISPGVKRPGPEADHSHLASAEVKNTWICTSPYVSMV